MMQNVKSSLCFFLFFFFVFSFLFCLAPKKLFAADFTVTSFHDPADATCPSDNCSLRAAIRASTNNGQDNVIHLSAGEYLIEIQPRTLRPGANYEFSLDENFGDFDIALSRHSLVIVGEGFDQTIINANGIDRVFEIFSGNVSLSGVTIQGGFPTNAFPIPTNPREASQDLAGVNADKGGGIYVHEGAILNFSNSVLMNNKTFGCGAGIANEGSVVITKSAIGYNYTLGLLLDIVGTDYVPGYSYEEQYHERFTPFIQDPDGCAGLGCHFSLSSQGGGLCNQGSRAQANLTHVSINNNSAKRYGAGIINNLGAQLYLNNVTVSGNRVEKAQIFEDREDYSVGQGGGLFNANGARAHLMNVTLANNFADISGGGISNGVPGISGSSNAVDGGMLYIQNSILSHNTFGASATASNCFGAISSSGNNISDDGTCSTFINPRNHDHPQGVNPLLEPLANNGGLLHTHALRSGSPAIDGVTFSDASTQVCPATDARGVNRPQGERCDIGAYEAETSPGAISFFPRSQDFGVRRPSGASSERTVTVRNMGAAPVRINTLSTSDPGQFTIISSVYNSGSGSVIERTDNTACNGQWLKYYHSTCSITIRFNPSRFDLIPINGTLDINGNLSVTGEGVLFPAYHLTGRGLGDPSALRPLHESFSPVIFEGSAALSSDVSELRFERGDVSSLPQCLIFTNSGLESLTIGANAVSIEGAGAAAFTGSGDCGGLEACSREGEYQLNPHAQCSVNVKIRDLPIAYTSRRPEPLQANLRFTGRGASAIVAKNVALHLTLRTADAIFRSGITDSNIDFGSVAATRSTIRTIRIENNGNGSFHVSRIQISGSSAWSVQHNCTHVNYPSGSGASSNNFCDVFVEFRPNVVGDFNATLNIESNSWNPLPPISLRGRGLERPLGTTTGTGSAVPGSSATSTTSDRRGSDVPDEFGGSGRPSDSQSTGNSDSVSEVSSKSSSCSLSHSNKVNLGDFFNFTILGVVFFFLTLRRKITA